MTDIVDECTRSRMMSSIRSHDTRPEMIVRKWLHARGFRFRLHRKDLPGRPDIVLPKYNTVVLVHGCFWHQHDGCHYATMPSTNTDRWRKKFADNKLRDVKVVESLINEGWRVLIVWECALKRDAEKNLEELGRFIVDGNASYSEIPEPICS